MLLISRANKTIEDTINETCDVCGHFLDGPHFKTSKTHIESAHHKAHIIINKYVLDGFAPITEQMFASFTKIEAGLVTVDGEYLSSKNKYHRVLKQPLRFMRVEEIEERFGAVSDQVNLVNITTDVFGTKRLLRASSFSRKGILPWWRAWCMSVTELQLFDSSKRLVYAEFPERERGNPFEMEGYWL